MEPSTPPPASTILAIVTTILGTISTVISAVLAYLLTKHRQEIEELKAKEKIEAESDDKKEDRDDARTASAVREYRRLLDAEIKRRIEEQKRCDERVSALEQDRINDEKRYLERITALENDMAQEERRCHERIALLESELHGKDGVSSLRAEMMAMSDLQQKVLGQSQETERILRAQIETLHARVAMLEKKN